MADIVLELGYESSDITELTVDWGDRDGVHHQAKIVFTVGPRILHMTVNNKGNLVNLVHARELPDECAES